MTKLTISETARFLISHDRYCILTHRRPDGDTLGSAVALCLGLRQLGKTAHLLENADTTDRYAWVCAGLTKPRADSGDTVVSTDVAAPSLLPANTAGLTVHLRIDHHASAASFSELEIVDGGSASCAELVWDILLAMGVHPDRPIAEAAYTGLSTDTGCFRYANTTPHTFAVAAACMKFGARVYDLNQELFESNTLGRLKMQGWISANMRILRSGKLAIIAIPREVEERIGVTEDDMDNISSFPRSVAGVCMAATLRQMADGDVKVSVRAVPGYDATAVTVKLGGGGHRGAAGATLRMSLADAALAVEQAMLEAHM